MATKNINLFLITRDNYPEYSLLRITKYSQFCSPCFPNVVWQRCVLAHSCVTGGYRYWNACETLVLLLALHCWPRSCRTSKALQLALLSSSAVSVLSDQCSSCLGSAVSYICSKITLIAALWACLLYNLTYCIRNMRQSKIVVCIKSAWFIKMLQFLSVFRNTVINK